MKPSYFYLVYTSLSAKLMDKSALLALLEQSRRNNAHFNLTGMLLYMEGRFINKKVGRFVQILEGAEENVMLVYERILADERNHSVITISTGNYKTRCFADWSMGFEVLDETACNEIPAYFLLGPDFVDREVYNESSPLKYLKAFYQINTEPF